MIKDKVVQDFLAQKLSVIKQEFAPVRLILFGSRIYGQPTKDSDIDLVVVADFFKGWRFLGRMGYFLKKVNFREHIDAFCYTPEEFERMKEISSVVAEAVAKGMVVS